MGASVDSCNHAEHSNYAVKIKNEFKPAESIRQQGLEAESQRWRRNGYDCAEPVADGVEVGWIRGLCWVKNN